MSATLTIKRKVGFNGALRDAAILVDDQKVGVVGNGKSIDIQLTAGRHVIRTRMDWVKSPPLEIDARAGGRYAAELSLCNAFLSLFAVLGMLPYMKLRLA